MTNLDIAGIDNLYAAFGRTVNSVGLELQLQSAETDLGPYKDGGASLPLKAFSLWHPQSFLHGATDIFTASLIHGDEPDTFEIHRALIQSFSENPHLAYFFGTVHSFPVASPGAYLSGKRENLRGTDINRTFWADTHHSAEDSSVPEEVRLIQNYLRTNAVPTKRAIYLDFHSDDRHPDTAYLLVNSNPLSANIGSAALKLAEGYGIRIHSSGLKEHDTRTKTEIFIEQVEDGVYVKDHGFYRGAFGPVPGVTFNGFKQLEITVEINYRDTGEAVQAGKTVALAILAAYKELISAAYTASPERLHLPEDHTLPVVGNKLQETPTVYAR